MLVLIGESRGVYKKNWKGPAAENEVQRENHSKQRDPQSRKPFSVWWQCEHVAPESPPWWPNGEIGDQSRPMTPPDRKGLSRLWVPLFRMIFPLNFVFCRGTFPLPVLLKIKSSRR